MTTEEKLEALCKDLETLRKDISRLSYGLSSENETRQRVIKDLIKSEKKSIERLEKRCNAILSVLYTKSTIFDIGAYAQLYRELTDTSKKHVDWLKRCRESLSYTEELEWRCPKCRRTWICSIEDRLLGVDCQCTASSTIPRFL